MRRFVAVIVLLVIALTETGLAYAGDRFRASLNGSQEVPPVETGAFATFKIHFNNTETEAEFTLTVFALLRTTQAHIHCGAPGVNGPIILWLGGLHPASGGWDLDGQWVSNARVTDDNITNTMCGATLAEIAQQMREGNTYANVHTLANPGGEIRGQILQE